MNELQLKSGPCVESNDHQVRILIDRMDVLGEKHFGIDPPLFFEQPSLTKGGSALIGRCNCGCIGCDDIEVMIEIDNSRVTWNSSNAEKWIFEKDHYLKEIFERMNDFSWETPGRTAERLLTPIFEKLYFIEEGFKLNWVSSRFDPKRITISYSKDNQQQLLCFNWDGIHPGNAIDNSSEFIRKTRALYRREK